MLLGLLGLFLLSLPFLGLFLLMVAHDGLGVALCVFGAIALILICAAGGIMLLEYAGWITH